VRDKRHREALAERRCFPSQANPLPLDNMEEESTTVVALTTTVVASAAAAAKAVNAYPLQDQCSQQQIFCRNLSKLSRKASEPAADPTSSPKGGYSSSLIAEIHHHLAVTPLSMTTFF
jgi:hypothetical protein